MSWQGEEPWNVFLICRNTTGSSQRHWNTVDICSNLRKLWWKIDAKNSKKYKTYANRILTKCKECQNIQVFAFLQHLQSFLRYSCHHFLLNSNDFIEFVPVNLGFSGHTHQIYLKWWLAFISPLSYLIGESSTLWRCRLLFHTQI